MVLASGATLVGLAVLGGIVLTANLFALVAHQQREELAALRAIGPLAGCSPARSARRGWSSAWSAACSPSR